MSVTPDSERATDTGQRPAVDPQLPQVFGRYLLVQRLSRGGMGEIFLAKHGLPGFEKLAVIKKVLPNFAEDKQFISRFVDEAQVAIKLQHVNIAQVFEVGRVGDEYFLALEHVDGRDLRRTLTKLDRQARRVPVDLALLIGRELASGLSYAHRRIGADGKSLNLVHCDISPPNILVSFEGETKIIDFGIARSKLRATASDPKMGFGKFGYMAPEQLIRGGVVDYRTDIYAAGVVIYELLTGERLYDATNPDYRALARAVAKGEHKLPSAVDPALAPFDGLIAKALRPKQDERFQSAAELRDEIQRALVPINATVTHDQLGAFMREVFSDEMATQREINERIARTHIADYQSELATQSIETISFALSQGEPLAADGSPVPASRTRTPSKVTRPPLPAPALPQLGEGTGATELSVADIDSMPTGAGGSPAVAKPLAVDVVTEAGPTRRGPVVGLAIAAFAAVIAVIVVLMMRGGTSDETTPETPPPNPGSAVAVAPPPAAADAAAAVVEPQEIEMPVDDGSAAPPKPTAEKKDRRKDREKKDREKGDKDKRPPSPPAAGSAAAEQAADLASGVKSKIAAFNRDYREFKDKFGSRLEDERAAMMSKLQYAKTVDDWRSIEKQVDRLRAKMKDASQ